MKCNKEFYIDSLVLISTIVKFYETVCDELKNLLVSDYEDKFKKLSEAIQKNGEKIDAFIKKWDIDDGDGICNSLKIIKEYYGYYCVMLGNSSISLFQRDANYLIDSIKTSKLIFESKLKAINNKI